MLGLILASATGTSHPLSCKILFLPWSVLVSSSRGRPCGVSAVLQNLFGAVPHISLVLEGRVGAQAVFVHPCAHVTPGRSSCGSLHPSESVSASIPWLSCSNRPSRGLRLPKKPDDAQHHRIPQNPKLPSAVCYKPGCSQCDVKWFHTQVQVFSLSFPAFPCDQMHP